MSFNLTYAGVPLCDETPEQREWLAQSLPIDIPQSLTLDQRSWPGPKLLGLTYPFRYPESDYKIGDFFYPTGASRWSEFNAVITQREYDLIVAAAFLGSNFPPLSQPFVMQQDNVTLTTSLYTLPPKPLAKFGTLPGLYLLTLVDERYYFQNFSAGRLTITDSTTWTSLISNLASVLGISLTLTTPIESDYGQPHPDCELTSNYENAALLLDACLTNIGRDLVRNFDGTYAAPTFAESAATVAANRLLRTQVLAGGDFLQTLLTNGNANLTVEAILPASVTVTFPKRVIGTNAYVNPVASHVPYGRVQGDVVAKTFTLSDAGFSAYGSGTPGSKTLHDTAEAWLYASTDSTAANDSQLTTLALKLAEDFYMNQIEGTDVSFPLIAAWTPEGFHDLMFRWNCDRCYTRILRDAYNLGVEEMLHHFVSPPASSSSSSSSGNGVSVVTAVSCNGSSLSVTNKTLTGNVVINGVTYNVTFNLGG